MAVRCAVKAVVDAPRVLGNLAEVARRPYVLLTGGGGMHLHAQLAALALRATVADATLLPR
ncbi:hypothetical protein E2562_035025 [Oryza meyeriana var. granulata]|uniref:Uncharacterized protein n=1 Tax=Oryza meyeriana var. granulata TaxID=110450 RepID=A0A6G1FF79_9ORYZ|nr:hypothetical protein E2562_035025 [Oryza meyeriana var. granulata]